MGWGWGVSGGGGVLVAHVYEPQSVITKQRVQMAPPIRADLKLENGTKMPSLPAVQMPVPAALSPEGGIGHNISAQR